jgi:flagellar hook-associated protein FlgK
MGLTGLLNVAKNGLISHQTSLQTIGHNLSNVNTRGYSRQDTITHARIPTPMSAGFIGNGVVASDILRDYDQFITKTLFEKASDMSGSNTKQAGLKLVEGVLNEVDENGLNEQINQFWTAWDDIANYAEGMPERTTLLQRADLLVKEIRGKYTQLVDISNNVDININTVIKDINRLADQVAEINVQIVSSEAGNHTANDLRDQRDMLVKRMAELADINYFETERGAYTVLIGQGSPLVEGPTSWHLDMRSGDVYWNGSGGQSVKLTHKVIQAGELGGWMELKSRVRPSDPTILTGSVPNSSGGRAIRSSTQWGDIDGVSITGNFTISFSGTDQSGAPVSGSYTGNSTATVEGLLNAIESAFPNVEATVTDDGRLRIEDTDPDLVPISFQIEDITGSGPGDSITGLDLGKFDADYPLNYTEQLNKWASELIKAVNGVHSQGVGLVPLQETTSENAVISASTPISSRASGLEFSDVVTDGSFEIYLYDSNGDVIDADNGTDIIEPYSVTITEGTTTLEDIRDDINTNTPVPGLSARIINNRLVIGIDGSTDAAGFAFGRDTSGALTALGINSFFTGKDAATIDVNTTLVEDPRLIAAAQVERYGAATALSSTSVMDADRPLDAAITDGTIHIELLDSTGAVEDFLDINVDRTTDSLDDILDQMNGINGIHAWVENDLVHVEAEENGYTVSIDDSAGGPDTGFLEFLDMAPGPDSRLDAGFRVERTFDILSSYDTGITTGAAFSIDVMDSEGDIINAPPPSMVINVNAGDSLSDIAHAIDSQDNISAQIVNGRLRISVEGDGERFYIRADNTDIMDYLQISTPNGGAINPANNLNALEIRDLNTCTVTELDGSTLNEFYQGLVGTVGIHSRGFQLEYDFARASFDELETRRDDVSGVSLDEEMSDLIKFQHAYTAAAKLIKAADEMFLSLLQAK